MHQFTERLQEVAEHYQSGDYHLGLRRMLDAALETRNPAIFEKALTFCDANEKVQESNLRTLAEQLLADMAKAAPIKSAAANNSNVVDINNVSKTYNKGKFKLQPVSLTLKPGEIAGLVGENGNGKTTFLRIIGGELRADTGSVNYKLSNNPKDDYDRRTALVFIPQRIPRWWGTLTDNLHLAARHYGLVGRDNELWVEMIIARLGLRPYKQLSWGTISSGYRTRFEIARTLLRRPEVLLLDEPLANLDIISQQTILQDLKYLAQSTAHPMAIVLSSQQIYEVEKVSDKIIFLKQGSPVYHNLKQAEGTATETNQTVVFEIETTGAREVLQKALEPLQLTQLQYNGGVYLAGFAAGVSAAEVLAALAAAPLEVTYFRNITNSSRRFFAQP
ncbi:MAG TPA: ABC transporter ATP-binding protein [Chitinophagales bacterium]|nr:ABC transporter ATP-binding protein [Chitinophagales bacterium]